MEADDNTSTDSFRVYLAPAEFIDSDHASITRRAASLAGGLPCRSAVAIRLFEYVRDLTYEADDFERLDNYRASRVLAVGRGYCVAKAGLLAALARAIDIPARVAFADVRNHLASDRLLTAMGTDVFAWHGYTQLRLDGRWVAVSPTFDPSTCDRAGVDVLEFDGVHDALLQSFGPQQCMRYEHYRGHFHDIPARFLAGEMPRRYPFVANGGLDRYKAGEPA